MDDTPADTAFTVFLATINPETFKPFERALYLYHRLRAVNPKEAM